MAIEPDDRSIVETWSGSIGTKDVTVAESGINRLGAYGYALERLMIQRRDFVRTASSRKFGDDSIDHQANIKATLEDIDALVSFVNNSTDITLNTTAAALFKGAAPQPQAAVTLEARNPRRG